MKSTKEQLLHINEKLNGLIDSDVTQEDAIQEVNKNLKSIGYSIQPLKDYVAENQRILDKWRNEYVQKNKGDWPEYYNLHEYFAPDGIMYKGEFCGEERYFKDEEKDCYYRLFRWVRISCGEENVLWSKAPLRVLFLTKDQNTGGNPAWDVRSESFRYISEEYKPDEMWLDTNNAFYRNLVYTLYGILKTTVEQPICYNDFKDKDALAFVDKQIFARINCKKEVGGKECKNPILKKAIDRDRDFLKQQILNLDADIFVCCGLMAFMPDFLNEMGYEFAPQDKDKWIYYDSKHNKVAINSYHLSYLRFDYVGMISAYHEFLKRNPAFTDSHRK
jgi:hypothetical protein